MLDVFVLKSADDGKAIIFFLVTMGYTMSFTTDSFSGLNLNRILFNRFKLIVKVFLKLPGQKLNI